MRFQSLLILAAGTMTATGCMTNVGPSDTEGAAQARLNEATAGRTALPPVACVNMRELRGNRGIGPGLIQFDGIGNRIYLNETTGCTLRSGLALVIRTSTTTLCRGEIVQVVDPTNGIGQGSCALGEFTPYERNR